MPMLRASAEIGDIMELLDLPELPSGCRFSADGSLTLQVLVTQGEIDEHASEPEPERVFSNARDVREGLRAILVGDVRMASTLLVRAFGDDVEAARAVEEELR